MGKNLVPTNIALAAAQKQLAVLSVERSTMAVHSQGPNPLLNTPLLGEANPATLFLMKYHGLSKSTHESRLRRIAKMMGAPNSDYQWLNWPEFTAIRIEAFLNDLYEPYIENGRSKRRAPSTLNGYLDSLRGVMRQVFKKDLISQKEWAEIQEIKALRNKVPLAGRMAEPDETHRLISALNEVAKTNPAKAARDRAIFNLAFLSGLRRHEFSNLDIDHYNFHEGKLTVRGKGGKIQDLEIAEQVIEAIDHWLAFRGHEQGALFYRVSKAGDILDERLCQGGIRYIFQTYTKKAGIEHLTPHDARRTFSSNVLDDPDIDPKTAMDLLRHSSFNTTAQYDRRSGKKRRKVVDRLSM